MVELHLNDRIRSGLQKLGSAPPEAAEELLAKVKVCTPAFVGEDFADGVARGMTHWDRGSIDAVLPPLLSLSLARAKFGVSVDAFVARVAVTLANSDPHFAKRLASFLTLESLDISAKAFDVLTNHQKTFLDARIFTDVRSIFADEVSAGPAAAVIVHKLKVAFRKNDAPHETFFALDSKDLAELAEVIKRAQAKDEALRRTLQSAGIKFLEPR